MKLLTLSIFLVWLCLALSFALRQNDGRIADGKEAVEGQFPWQALLWVEKHSLQWDGEILCGGSLISPDVILTSAGCLWPGDVPDEDRPVTVTGFVGRVTLQGTGGFDIYSQDFDIHEGFDPFTYEHNIALVYLNTTNVNAADVQTIPVGSVSSGVNVTISGWADDQAQATDVLHYRDDLITISNEDCERLTSFANSDTVCTLTSAGDAGVTPGDGGGGLVSGFPDRPVLVGIPSFIGVFYVGHTRADSYERWITERILNRNMKT